MSIHRVARLVGLRPAPRLGNAIFPTTLANHARRSFVQTTYNAHQSKTSKLGEPSKPIGVAAALRAAKDPSFQPRKTLQDEFDLSGRVAVVTGGNRGIGLEMAETLCEAGATVYCLDLPSEPGEEWSATRNYVERICGRNGRLEYRSVDVTNQDIVWDVVEKIGDREKRVDACVAAAGILVDQGDCLACPADEFQKVMSVNTNGVFYTAQAAGRQMDRFGIPGSIILIASMSGSITNRDGAYIPYNTSKSAVLQMGRSMACELGHKGIRVNTISPGHIHTAMTAAYLKENPEFLEQWASLNPLNRIGRPDELRGVVAWLASDASTFCTGSDILVSGGHHAW